MKISSFNKKAALILALMAAITLRNGYAYAQDAADSSSVASSEQNIAVDSSSEASSMQENDDQAVASTLEGDIQEASAVTFLIPSSFTASTKKGVFVDKRYPLEASSISYASSYNGQDILLTNAQKLSESSMDKEPTSYTITQDTYQEAVSQAYNEKFGKDVGFTIDSFEETTYDGYKGYKIVSHYQAEEQEAIQTVIIIESKYRTFTVSYERAQDDDCQQLFDESMASIHVLP